jgi:hypothetical protein
VQAIAWMWGRGDCPPILMDFEKTPNTATNLRFIDLSSSADVRSTRRYGRLVRPTPLAETLRPYSPKQLAGLRLTPQRLTPQRFALHATNTLIHQTEANDVDLGPPAARSSCAKEL